MPSAPIATPAPINTGATASGKDHSSGTDQARRARSRTVTASLPVTPRLVAVMVAVPSLNPVTVRVDPPLLRMLSPLTDAISGAEDDHAKRPGSNAVRYSVVPSAASASAYGWNRVPRKPMVRSDGVIRIDATTVSGVVEATVSGTEGATGAARSSPHPPKTSDRNALAAGRIRAPRGRINRRTAIGYFKCRG